MSNRFMWNPEDVEITRADGIVIPTDPAALAKRAKTAEAPLPESGLAPQGTVTDPGSGGVGTSPPLRKNSKQDGILGRKGSK